MIDIVDPATRSRMMSGIKGKNTVPELQVRKFLHAAGLRYRLNVRALPGSPDIVLARWKVVIFVHGCFWHRHGGCRFAYTPKSREAFWLEKFQKNAVRDALATSALQKAGWRVVVVWECTLRSADRLNVLAGLVKTIKGEAND